MTKGDCTINDILTELRCRLDLGHFPQHVSRRVERAFDQHADGHPDGLLSLLRAARFMSIKGAWAEHYKQLASTIARTRLALEEEAHDATRSR